MRHATKSCASRAWRKRPCGRPYWVRVRTRACGGAVRVETSWKMSPNSGRRDSLAGAGAREAVEHGSGEPVAARDLEPFGGPLRPEGAHPGGHGAAHGRRRLGAADLRDLGPAALHGHQELP